MHRKRGFLEIRRANRFVQTIRVYFPRSAAGVVRMFLIRILTQAGRYE